MSDEILDQASETEQGMGARQRRTRWLLWIQWVLVSAVGWAFLGWAYMAWARGQIRDGPLGFAVLALGFVCVVLGQWLVLRPRLVRAGWWLFVTPVGFGSGGYAALLAVAFGGAYFGWPAAVLALLATLLVGTPVGFLQWLVLRRQMRRALWWVPLTLVAIGASLLALWLCLLVLAELPAGVIESAIDTGGGAELPVDLAGVLLGAVYGAITGTALVVLLPHRVQTQDRKPLQSRLVVGIALLSLLVICLGWGILTEPVNGRHLLIQHWFGRRDFYGIHLQGADLSGANLVDVFMPRADLSGADLTGADLSEAWLWGANLSGANLTGADLTDATLCDADLTNADLSGADLRGAIISSAILRGATVTNEQLAGAHMYTPAILPDGTHQ